MSEALHPDQNHNVIRFPNKTVETDAIGSTLLPLTDSSLPDKLLSERLEQEIDPKDVLRFETREERTRYFINTALIVAGATYHFADLRTKERQDAVQTLAITQIISKAERFLINVEAQDGMKKLTNELYELYDEYEDTNLIRTLGLLKKRYQSKHPIEIVQSMRIAFLALCDHPLE